MRDESNVFEVIDEYEDALSSKPDWKYPIASDRSESDLMAVSSPSSSV